jgi:predicted Zn-dependent protease
MRSKGISPVRFASLMRRVEERKSGAPDIVSEKWINYLSTHPLTDERLEDFEKQ